MQLLPLDGLYFSTSFCYHSAQFLSFTPLCTDVCVDTPAPQRSPPTPPLTTRTSGRTRLTTGRPLLVRTTRPGLRLRALRPPRVWSYPRLRPGPGKKQEPGNHRANREGVLGQELWLRRRQVRCKERRRRDRHSHRVQRGPPQTR